MNKEKWNNFQTLITSILTNQMDSITHTNTSIDKLWHALQTTILTSANKNIPYSHISNKIHKTFSPTATNLHQALNNINNIIQPLNRLTATSVNIDTTPTT